MLFSMKQALCLSLYRCDGYCTHRLNTEQVDISELTWEQKEKVLRYLFARMNRIVSTPAAAASNKAMAKPVEKPQQPSLMDREAWLVVLYIICALPCKFVLQRQM